MTLTLEVFLKIFCKLKNKYALQRILIISKILKKIVKKLKSSDISQKAAPYRKEIEIYMYKIFKACDTNAVL